jgi:hypothetical protein
LAQKRYHEFLGNPMIRIFGCVGYKNKVLQIQTFLD